MKATHPTMVRPGVIFWFQEFGFSQLSDVEHTYSYSHCHCNAAWVEYLETRDTGEMTAIKVPIFLVCGAECNNGQNSSKTKMREKCALQGSTHKFLSSRAFITILIARNIIAVTIFITTKSCNSGELQDCNWNCNCNATNSSRNCKLLTVGPEGSREPDRPSLTVMGQLRSAN